jgi:hypothetical protein
MKYRIQIEEIDEVKGTRSSWVRIRDRVSESEGDNYDYRDIENTSEEKTLLYEQTREAAIDLMEVIKAFNK